MLPLYVTSIKRFKFINNGLISFYGTTRHSSGLEEFLKILQKYHELLPASTKQFNELKRLCNQLAIPQHYQNFYEHVKQSSQTGVKEEDTDNYRGETIDEL